MENKNELAEFLAEKIIGVWDEVGNCNPVDEAKQVKQWLIEFEDKQHQDIVSKLEAENKELREKVLVRDKLLRCNDSERTILEAENAKLKERIKELEEIGEHI